MGEIIKLRKEINKIDREIIILLKKRFEVSRKIGDYKKENNLKIRDLKRENEIINKKIKESKLDKKFVKNLYGLIFRESRRMQK
jgi:monofunctional chorismate mutase